MKYLTVLLSLLVLSACSKNPNNFTLNCYGQQSLAIDNQLTKSIRATKKYQFQNKSMSDHLCTAVEKTIQCSQIKDEGDTNINHYIILAGNYSTIYETTITTHKNKGSEKKNKETSQGQCSSPIF